MRCKVCDGLIKDNGDNWTNVRFTYTLHLDTVCMGCFYWMDAEMAKHYARKYDPYRRNNPYIIYYEDRSPYELQRGTDTVYSSYAPPVYMP